MRYQIDASDRTFLGLCSCGRFRGLALSRYQALARLAEHEAVMHPRDTDARANLHHMATRHAARASRSRDDDKTGTEG